MQTRKIGVLRGMEDSFPDGLIAHLNADYGDRGIVAEYVEVGPISQDGFSTYAVILDRISHEVPFYRSYLKWASLKGTYVANNPFWWSADDKFIDNVIAQGVGVAVPRSVILPHKERPERTEATSFRNLVHPLPWDETFAYIGFPAYLKPHDGGGWRGVTKVHNPAELFAAYDASGTDCMILQEDIAFEDYFRCYGVGQREVRVMRYNPVAPHHERYSAVNPAPIEPALLAKLERDVLALCRALGYDLNTVELAVRDGIPYAIDFMNPAPDAEYGAVGQESYEWVVRRMGAFLAEKALEDRPAAQFTANGALEPARSTFAAVRGAAESARETVSETVTEMAESVGEVVEAVKKAVSKRRAKQATTEVTIAEVRESVADAVQDTVEAVKKAVAKRSPKATAAAPSATASAADGAPRRRTPKA